MNPEYHLSKPYAKGAYNIFDQEEQHIRITEGCPNKCLYCAESWENGTEPIYYEIPEIVRNKVVILDMNLLSKPRAKEIIENLGQRRVNGKIVYYELQCGIDYRFLTQELAACLKRNHFINIRLAWDYGYSLAYKIKDSLNMLTWSGYAARDIQVFMIANYRLSAEEFKLKMSSLAWRGVQVADCWYDNQKKGSVEPIYWTAEQIKEISVLSRNHNIMCRHNGIQPELVNKYE